MQFIYRLFLIALLLLTTKSARAARELCVEPNADAFCTPPDPIPPGACGSCQGHSISLQNAMTNVVAGDTVRIRAGTYRPATESDDLLWHGYTLTNKVGTSSAQIQFIGATMDDPAPRIIDGMDTRLGPSSGLINGSSSAYVLIQGLTLLKSSGRGISVTSGNNVTIDHCHISKTWDQGAVLSGRDHTFQNNEVDNAYERNFLGRCEVAPCPAECAEFCGPTGSGVNTWGTDIAPYYSTGISFRENHIHHIWGECLGLYASAFGWAYKNTIHECRAVNLYISNARFYNVLNNYIYNGLDTGTDCAIVPTAPQCFYKRIPTPQPAIGILISKEPDVAYPDPLHNLNFYNNVMDNNLYGFSFWYDDNNRIPGNTYDNIIFTNNVIRNSTLQPVRFEGVQSPGTAPFASKLENNIIYGSIVVFQDPNAWSPATGGSVNNNIFVNPDEMLPSGLPPSAVNNIPTRDARLCRNDSLLSGNADIYNYFIQPGSLAIGAAIFEPVAPEDYDWVTRTPPINAGINQVPRTINCQ